MSHQTPAARAAAAADRAGTRRVPRPRAHHHHQSPRLASPHSPPVHDTARHGQISEERQKTRDPAAPWSAPAPVRPPSDAAGPRF